MRFIFKTDYDQDIRLAKHGGHVFWYSLLGLFLAVAPWALPEYWLAQLTFVLIYAIVGLGLMLLAGFTGLFSLGHAAFLGVGAYTEAVLTNAGWPFPVSIACAGLLSAAVGMVVGLPALRVKGIYLGIATLAVHLVGLAPDGRMWVQKRALTKPNDPGLWDTLMGGMIAATDSLEQALARETWEEAGLRVADLQHVTQGGHVLFSRPSSEAGGMGYMVERIDWFRATVPEGLEPTNQDGEVDEFALRSTEELHADVAQDRFTLEAALVMAAHWGR